MYLKYSHSFPFIFFIILLAIPFSTSQYVNDERYTNCVPTKSTCGLSTQTIKYPFWDSNLPKYCGHPNFRLDCQDGALTIDVSNQSYNLLDINYNSYTFTISNPVLSKILCPPDVSLLKNFTLDYSTLNFTTRTQNATLFYDCSSSPDLAGVPYDFSCISTSYNSALNSAFNSTLGYFALNDGNWKDLLGTSCGFSVYVPVLKNVVLGLVQGSSSIIGVLSKGFEVKWLIDDKHCDDCMNSGGRCGYNDTSNMPTCFCKSGAKPTSCSQSEAAIVDSNNSQRGKIDFKTKAAILGVAAAASGSLIFMTIFFFLYRRRLKKSHSTAPFLAQNKSYDSSNAYSSSSSDLQIVSRSTYFGVQVFNYRELEEATDFFNPLKELGDGGFGTVYYGKLRDGREVAIKRLYENNNKRANQQFMNEVEILAHLRHRNLVTLYGCTPRQSRELLLVYEYVPNGTVADHLYGKRAKENKLPWSRRLSIAVETASALVHLHASDIIHRDIKTQNILLDKDFSVKVADFGLSRLFPLDVTHVSTAPQGTPGYVDPEYHQCYQLTEKSDVYSFGVVLAEVISSKPAVDITRRRNEINLSNMATEKIQNHQLHELVDPSLGFETDLKVKNEITAVAELAFQCLQGTREMRPSMEEILELLYSIMGRTNKDSEADVVDIPADDIFLLKGDFSPPSPRRDDNRRYMPYASV